MSFCPDREKQLLHIGSQNKVGTQYWLTAFMKEQVYQVTTINILKFDVDMLALD